VKRFAIFGVGGFGRGIMPIAHNQLTQEQAPYELVFVDDHVSIHHCNGHPVVTYDQWLKCEATSRAVSLAVADPGIREKLAERCKRDGIEFFEIRASNVVQLDRVLIDQGAVLCPFVTLTSNIRIGKHFHANLYSYVEHDCVIGDFVTFAPGVKCNGNVVIEDHVYVGAGAVIKQGTPGSPLVIGQGAVIGMGAVVTKSVFPSTIVVGNPARLHVAL
jgi:sugar O-acyltransferase (sialic acid O-acetyltransferase NeuD family)